MYNLITYIQGSCTLLMPYVFSNIVMLPQLMALIHEDILPHSKIDHL
jgi:hypothetical protein